MLPVEIIAPTYNTSNILGEFTDCPECNALCYKLIDCDGYQTVATTDDFAAYVGHVIKWKDALNEERCANVEVYVCRKETLPTVPIIVLDCFHTCLECNPPIPPKEDFTFTPRPVNPGYSVPECSTGSTCAPCASCQSATPCDTCSNT